MRIRIRLLTWGALGLCLVSGQPALGDPAAPFRVRNLNPLVAVFGLPTWEPVPEARVFGTTMGLANHYRLSRRGTEQIIIDGETLKLTFFYEQPFASDWSVGVELPLVRQSGGWLDNVIDAWHSGLDLPDGGRNNRPQDVILFQLADRGRAFYQLDQPASGIGDLRLSLARRLGASNRLVLRGSLKLSTGDESILAGSGTTDFGVTLMQARESQWRRLGTGYYWGVGLLDLAQPDQIRFAAERFGYLGILGGGVTLGRFGIKAQVDVHSAFYDSPLKEIGETAALFTLGGWRTFPRGRLDFGIVEDLHVSTAPDAIVHLSYEWRGLR